MKLNEKIQKPEIEFDSRLVKQCYCAEKAVLFN